MTKCLYCGKEIKPSAGEEERNSCWHKKCIKSFFGTSVMPELNVSEEELEELANETVNQGLTVPGVQKKLSLHLSQEKDVRLTIVNHPTGYILKPQTTEYAFLPELEELAMDLAEMAGVSTVAHGLIKMNESYAYITRRIDREFTDGRVSLYAMEDFCQLSGRLTADKYRGSYEQCGRIIKKYSAYAGLDMSELFLRVIFSFVIGNSDMHLKNFSMKEITPSGRAFQLSQAYDILPVNVILPEDEDELALTLNGKKRNLRKKDFLEFAQNCGIAANAAEKMMRQVCSLEKDYLKYCEESYLNDNLKQKVKDLIVARINRLS